MAVPSPGKCSLLLVLLLVLYSGCAFRIRDGLGPSAVEHRSSSCPGGSAKCSGDERSSRTESTSAGLGSMPVGKKRFDAAASFEVPRGRLTAKIQTSKQPPVSRDDDEKSSKVSLGVEKSIRESRRIRFSRLEMKVDDKDSQDDEDDDDDDGVEITVEDEESTEMINDDDDDEDEDDDNGDDDDDNDDDGDDDDEGDDGDDDDGGDNVDDIDEGDDDDDDDSNDLSKNNGDEDEGSKPDDSKGENESEDDIDDEDEDGDDEDEDRDDEIESSRKIKTGTISSFGNERRSNVESSSAKTKTLTKKKIVAEEEDSGDEDNDSEEEQTLKEQKRIKESKKDKIDIEDKSKKKVMKEDGDDENSKGGEDDDDDEDEDDEDDDEDEEDEDDDEEEQKVTPAPIRKLEKVRLADKEKVRSMEALVTPKPVLIEAEKSVKVKETPKITEDTRAKKKKSPEEGTKSTKLEIEKSESTIPTKRETTAKVDDSSKSTKKSTPSPKTEVPKKSTPEKVEVKKKVEKDDKVVVTKSKDDASSSKREGTKKLEKSKAKSEIDVKKGSEKKVIQGDGKTKKTPPSSKKILDTAMSLTQLNEAILQVPTFVPNFTSIEDPVCQQHGKIFLRQLRGYKLWALQMLDSSAKIASGLLRGNVNQFGDFDQCLGITARVKVDEKTVKVQGKYCLASLDIHATIPDMKVPVNYIQSRGFIRANMRDPGHFIPRFTTANWAVCIPAACSAQDARDAIRNSLSHIDANSGLKFTIEVEPEMCYVRQKSQTYTKETIGVLYFYAMIICIVLIATIRDCFVSQEGKGSYSERIIMSFSLRRTARILTKDENTSAGEISCIHGIRSLATIALYVAHKMIPTSQMPYANRISLTEIANNPISSLLRTSLAYTDCFLLLSGLLTAFNMARESAKRGEIRWFCRLVARFIRLTPALLIVIFWYAYVMEHTGSGPLWHRSVVTNAELCKQNSWTNLLYIQNFFPFEEMCATHTHQLALDMQLSLIAPVLVFFLTLKPIIGVLVIFFILQVSATIRYFATTNNNLSLVIFHGMTMRQLYKTANLTYALPLHRATPYVFGVALGVFLHWTGKNVRIYKIFILFGWLIAMALGTWTLFSPWHMARRDYVYDVEEAAHYAVIAPVTWSLALCWIIFACYTGHGGIVNKFLSSYWMVLFSRISYAVYLCQFAIFFYNVGTTRYTTEVQVYNIVDLNEALVVTLIAVVLTLFIDIPMQTAKNVVMESTDGLASRAFAEGDSAEEEKTPDEKSSSKEDKEHSVPENVPESKEEEKEERRETWAQQLDVDDGLIGPEDHPRDEYEEKWRPRLKSNGKVYDRSQGDDYEDEEKYDEEEEIEEEEDEERQEEEYEDERPTEWSWVRKSRAASSLEDDGLLEHRRSRSSQRGSYVDPEPEIRRSPPRRYEREDESRQGRRSLSRQPERSHESPRSSVKRERSRSREETRARYPEEYASPRRLESRGSSVTREQSVTSSRETSRRSPKRERSLSREDTTRRYSRSDSRVREQERAPSRDRHERSPSREPPRRPHVILVSSGSEEEPLQKPSKPLKRQPAEPKISDEEDWEQELRIRRQKFMERLASEDREVRSEEGNEAWNSVRRRSSAEGKIALLQDPTGSNVMDSWTVSRGPRVSLLGSSQETEDDISAPLREPKISGDLQRDSSLKEEDKSEEDSSRRRSYTSGSQVTSLEDEEEEEDTSGGDFVLSKDSRRITVVDLSKLSPEGSQEDTGDSVVKDTDDDEQKPIVATLKLFKRESIVKSQASEEDPEYLLPERPKLQEQEQDHPFKKAWQLQKSRSEEDPMPYALKEVKSPPQQETSRTKASDKDDQDSKES